MTNFAMKLQISKAPAQRQVSSRPAVNDQRPKKRPARRYSDEEDDAEGDEAISLIRKMFGYKNFYSLISFVFSSQFLRRQGP